MFLIYASDSVVCIISSTTVRGYIGIAVHKMASDDVFVRPVDMWGRL